jgi:hypothetical protein
VYISGHSRQEIPTSQALLYGQLINGEGFVLDDPCRCG